MKCFVKIYSGVAMSVYRSDEKWSDDDYEITEEQFDSCALPCRAEVTEDCVVFGNIVPLEEIPDMSEPGKVEPVPEPEPTADDILNAMLGVE